MKQIIFALAAIVFATAPSQAQQQTPVDTAKIDAAIVAASRLRPPTGARASSRTRR